MLLRSPPGAGRAPGKGCSLGAGAEAWPGSQPCPQPRMAFLPGFIIRWTRARALYAPPKAPHIPHTHCLFTIICPRPRPSSWYPLCLLYQAPWKPRDTPPLILTSVVPSCSLSVVTLGRAFPAPVFEIAIFPLLAPPCPPPCLMFSLPPSGIPVSFHPLFIVCLLT